MYPWIYLLISIISLYFSFYFTYIKNTYVVLTQTKLKHLIELNPTSGKYLEDNYNNQNEVYSMTLILDYFFNFVMTISLALFSHIILPHLGVLISLFISSVLILIFGEIIPKSLGNQKVEKSISKQAKTVYFLRRLIKPITLFINFLSSVVVSLVGGDKNFKQPSITEDDIMQSIFLGYQEGLLDITELGFIENVISFKDSYAKDIMTPRTDIISIDVNTSYSDLVYIVEENGFSRMPVYENDIDNILGILHVKDLFTYTNHPEELQIKEILRPAFFTYEYKPISILLNELRSKKLSVAIVLDEYGGTEGIITIEDLIEKIVGSISDEYDEDEEDEIISLGGGQYLIEGSTNLDEINHILDLDLYSDEFDSIGGYIIEKIDRFPKKGETIIIDGKTFIIKEVQRNRIEKLILKT